MKLLDEWNWYLPRWLEWLPSLAAESRPTGPVTPPPAAAGERRERERVLVQR